MSVNRQQHPEPRGEEVSTAKKESWNAPIIVPLDTSLTEHNPGTGADGDFFPDSTLS